MTYPEMTYRLGARHWADSAYQQRNDYGSYQRGIGDGSAYDQQSHQKPAPAPLPTTHWSFVLGVSPLATRAEIKAAYKRLAKQAHPDAGGSDRAMARLNTARDAALNDRKAA